MYRNILVLIVILIIMNYFIRITNYVFLENTKILPNRSDVHPPAPTSRSAIMRCYKCGKTKDL